MNEPYADAKPYSPVGSGYFIKRRSDGKVLGASGLGYSAATELCDLLNEAYEAGIKEGTSEERREIERYNDDL